MTGPVFVDTNVFVYRSPCGESPLSGISSPFRFPGPPVRLPVGKNRHGLLSGEKP